MHAAVRKVPGPTPSHKAHAVAGAILRWHLGMDWVTKYVLNRSSNEFLAGIATDTPDLTHTTRVISLGEMVLNLREIDGFASIMEQLAAGQIESAFAELDVASYLQDAGVKFRFVRPQQKRGNDYDLEFFFHDGTIGYSDTKCKIESEKYRPSTITNTLDKYRNQLPAGKPGAFFIKIPQQWHAPNVTHFGTEFGDELQQCAKEFMRGTGRVVAVHFFTVSMIDVGDKKILRTFGIEVATPNNRIDKNKDWTLLASKGKIEISKERWHLLSLFK
jgi:hypothetical protein